MDDEGPGLADALRAAFTSGRAGAQEGVSGLANPCYRTAAVGVGLARSSRVSPAGVMLMRGVPLPLQLRIALTFHVCRLHGRVFLAAGPTTLTAVHSCLPCSRSDPTARTPLHATRRVLPRGHRVHRVAVASTVADESTRPILPPVAVAAASAHSDVQAPHTLEHLTAKACTFKLIKPRRSSAPGRHGDLLQQLAVRCCGVIKIHETSFLWLEGTLGVRARILPTYSR